MKVIVENAPMCVSFGSLALQDYFLAHGGELFKKNGGCAAVRVTGTPQPDRFFAQDAPVHKAEITAIHVRVVN